MSAQIQRERKAYYDILERTWKRSIDVAEWLAKLLDCFDGKLTSSKWAAIAKCSPDTALRDVNDLLVRGVLRKTQAGGRSTSYVLNDLPLHDKIIEK